MVETVTVSAARSASSGALSGIYDFGVSVDSNLDNILLDYARLLNEAPPAPLVPLEEVAVETPRIARPALSSLAAMNAYLDSLGSSMFGYVVPDDLSQLLDYAESPAGRAEDAAARAAAERAAARAAAEAAAIDVIPEVVSTASRLGSVARVLGGVPFGLATGILQGTYELGSYLSDLALRDAIDRITPPPTRPVAPAAPPADQPDSFIEGVTVSQPRITPPPTSFADPTLFGPGLGGLSLPDFSYPLPSPTSSPTSSPVPSPLAQPSPLSQPTGSPLDLAAPLPAPGTPRPSAPPSDVPGQFTLADPLLFSNPLTGTTAPPNNRTPTNSRDCDCKPKKQSKRKKKPRTICYAGSYRERSTSLSKRKRKRIPCQ